MRFTEEKTAFIAEVRKKDYVNYKMKKVKKRLQLQKEPKKKKRIKIGV